MAQVKIPDLPAVGSLADVDPFPMVDIAGNVTSKATLAQLKTFLQQTTAQVYAGASGSPEGVVSAFYGSLFTTDDGHFWRKTGAGFGNTGWNQEF